ncbi:MULTISPECIES: family 20 glycosylhydrolase [unclassified Pseudoxanthomonas]|uniref:family 20 glycosylhydrolase n=1 Tax=unclassified Pseudoxanthomonas TaxID=2645906 RepID=UPI00161E61E9|nr:MULTISPECIES: family 20 glycosylhydrolase [unclassified Pseudoxanthomonas]MBB3276521.1 hexosaminidase [Pseudoxanthomonas sp. OG2]MBV7472404.1 family 20 glycosylhydrolase [Pseudoxanthomonas sp. PXM05]
MTSPNHHFPRRFALHLGLLTTLVAAPALAGDAATSPAFALIPAPASLQPNEGAFMLDAGTTLHAEGEVARRVAGQFAEFLATTRGTRLVLSGPGEGGVVFALDPTASASSPEGYRLEVTPERVRVTAAHERGLFYGAVTLWQLATQSSALPARIPAASIQDAPRFPWRGFMLDSARHFQSLDEIKQILDAMALHKLNTFHWHLTDDQGWRIEIKKYPKLTEVGGCRVAAGEAGVGADGQPKPYCGFYTQDQIREIVKYAADRHIAVLPEIDVPGHAQAAIAAYPELGVLGSTPPVSNQWGVHSYLFNTEESTITFLEDVLTEVIALFPGRYVHVGADEAVKIQWENSARAQARIRELGLKNEFEMQSYIIKRLEKFLEAHNRRLIGWDEILEGGLPPEATVMSWRGTEGGLEAATQGHDVVMTPKSHLYLDYHQTTSPNEPPGRPTQVPLEKVYGFEPVPEALAPSLRHHILGLQANVWTEHTRHYARLQHHLYPRLAALAEVGWTPMARKDYGDFLKRLPAQLQRYRSLGIAYAKTPFEVVVTAQDLRESGQQVTLGNPLGYEIRYTLDGSVPAATSLRYAQPFTVTPPAQVRAAAFFDGKPLADVTGQLVDREWLLRRTSDALASCPEGGRLLLRLEDDGPREGARAMFNVTIFNPCWQWPQADLAGIAKLQVRAGRIPYYFQLAHDEVNRKFEPARSAHGELLVRAGNCKAEPFATVPLPASPDADGFVTLDANLPAGLSGRQDLCLVFTGDTRPAMWVLDEVRLVPR